MRKYSVQEVDDLRQALIAKYFMRVHICNDNPVPWRPEGEERRKSGNRVLLEEMVRTAMAAGHTAQEVRDSIERRTDITVPHGFVEDI